MLIQPFGFIGGGEQADLPLDTVTGAEIAVSLRKLRRGYTGDCMRVSDLNQNNVTNIGFAGDFVDNTALANYYNTYGSCYLFEWLDQSGNGYDFSAYATGSANRVEVYQSGSVVTDPNGTQCVLQKGLNMDFNKNQNGFDPGDEHSLYVTSTRSIGGYGYSSSGKYLISGTAGAARPAIISGYSADFELFYDASPSSLRVTIGNANDNDLHLVSVRRQNTGPTYVTDYDAATTNTIYTSLNTLPGDFRTLGTYNNINSQGVFKWSEFILFKNNRLSDSDNTFMNNDIVNYYNL